MNFSEHRSKLDRSVNFVAEYGGGSLEARYVRRTEDYFMAYLSSQSGCRLACRFCHLTRTRQVTFDQADEAALTSQLMRVMRHHDENETPSKRMNLNFMARGEPLLNPVVTGDSGAFIETAIERSLQSGVTDFMANVSTIFPEEASGVDLARSFAGKPVTLFWSLYSLDPSFRKRWIPKAQDPEVTFERIARYQGETGGPVVLHWALISGENDSDESLSEIAEKVRKHGIDARLNLVRYNPADGGTGAEAAEERYAAALRIMGEVMTVPGSRVVPRVGPDVKASCGMFVA